MSGAETRDAAHRENVNRTRSRSYLDDSIPIRLLPLSVRHQLCAHLDVLDVWPVMAKEAKLYPYQVDQIHREKQRGRSASNEFLHIWGGQYNHTVRTLFALFKK